LITRPRKGLLKFKIKLQMY